MTGKGGKTAPIPIHPEIKKLAARMPETGFWFPGSDGGHVTATAVSQSISNALTSAGSNATAHMLRDTAATRLQRTTRDIRLTQAMLRHSNIASTAKYTGASNAELQAAMSGMNWTDAAQQTQTVDGGDFGSGIAEQLAALTPAQVRQLSALLSAMTERDSRN